MRYAALTVALLSLAPLVSAGCAPQQTWEVVAGDAEVVELEAGSASSRGFAVRLNAPADSDGLRVWVPSGASSISVSSDTDVYLNGTGWSRYRVVGDDSLHFRTDYPAQGWWDVRVPASTEARNIVITVEGGSSFAAAGTNRGRHRAPFTHFSLLIRPAMAFDYSDPLAWYAMAGEVAAFIADAVEYAVESGSALKGAAAAGASAIATEFLIDFYEEANGCADYEIDFEEGLTGSQIVIGKIMQIDLLQSVVKVQTCRAVR